MRTGRTNSATRFFYRIIPGMPRTDLFVKIQLTHEAQERPEELAEEICRRLLKFPGVRSAELSSYFTHPDHEQPSSQA